MSYSAFLSAAPLAAAVLAKKTTRYPASRNRIEAARRSAAAMLAPTVAAGLLCVASTPGAMAQDSAPRSGAALPPIEVTAPVPPHMLAALAGLGYDPANDRLEAATA